MKRVLIFICSAVFFIATTIYAYTPSVYDIPVSRDLTGADLPTRSEYLAQFPERDMTIYSVTRSELRRDEEGTVVLVVNHRLLSEHEEGFQQYADDLSDEGYDVVLLDIDGGTPQELKDAVIEEGGDNLVGTVMAGELPLAWFEQFEYFDDEDEPDNPRLHEYPIDLFFMDIDGEWQDTSGNDIYDVHSGDWQPDIWFGRLPGYNLSRIDEDELISDYLDKIHRYRIGEMDASHSALSFIDDDWVSQAENWGNDMRLAYGGLIEEAHPETTSATRWRHHLNDVSYNLAQVCVHSGAEAHIFKIENRRRNDYFRFSHLREEVEPNVLFYNLYACSIMNLSRNLCMGALYALGSEFGLGAVGPSKTGGMLYFEDYYRRLGEGKSFGEALRLWMIDHIREEGHENWARSWFYCMTYFGDPTLKIRQGLRIASVEIDDSDEGDDDGRADASETVSLVVSIVNRGEVDLSNVEVICTTDDPNLDLEDAEGFIERLPADEEIQVEVGSMRIADDAPDNHSAYIHVTMTPADEQSWEERIAVEIHAPEYVLSWWDEFPWCYPGNESVLRPILFSNFGGDDQADNATLRIISLDGQLTPDAEEYRLQGDGNVLGLEAFYYIMSDDADSNSVVFVQTEVRLGDVVRGGTTFMLPTFNRYTVQDDFSEEPVWINHYPVNRGYADVWRWGDDAGDRSGGIAFGAPDSGLYPPNADAVFELPMQNVFTYHLEFRHRMVVEEDYDGGVLERRVEDGVWERVFDFNGASGYNGTSVDNGSFEGGDCWNGTFDWTNVSIALEGGPDQLRFRFASDGGVEGEGWFIDNIQINGIPLDVNEEQSTTPTEFTLISAYPNPFNGTTTIKYDVPAAGSIRMAIYDVNGRLVKTLHTGKVQAGQHKIVWDGSSNSSGIYLAVLEADGKVFTSKLLLIK